MIRKVFLDSDIILDVATGRQPFSDTGKMVLSLMENGSAVGMVSSNIVTNIHYILRRLSSGAKAKSFLRSLLKYITVISTDHRTVLDALKSDFDDFEDAVQHYSALSNNCDCIITRDVDGYRKSKLKVYSPTDFVRLFQT